MNYKPMSVPGKLLTVSSIETSKIIKSTDNSGKLRQLTTQLISCSETMEYLGLFDGKTGILLALHQAVKKFPDWFLLHQTIKTLQEEICDQAGGTDDTFSNGLFGIGWGIANLYGQRLITENETEVLGSFDNELYKLVMYSKAATHSLETGTMGRIHYFLKRIPESLKLSDKYSYVCNYEILMLLVDDFTNENEKIIASLQQNTTVKYLSENDLGKKLSQIFELLAMLVKGGIHKEITERQWLQLLKYFVMVYENGLPDGANRVELVNWLFVCNNLLKCARQSKTIAEKISAVESSFNLPFMPQTLQEMVFYKSYLKNAAHYFNKQPRFDGLNEGMARDKFNKGMEGLSGLVCLIAEEAGDGDDTLLEQLFLI